MDTEIRQRIERAAAALKAAGAREVYLFGSVAKGVVHEDSDIDMAVSGLPPQNYFEAMGQAVDILEHPLDLVDLDEENPFTRYLKAKGQLERVD